MPAGAEAADASSFTNWYYRSAVGDAGAARNEMTAARSKPALRDAFVALARTLVHPGPPGSTTPSANYRLAAAALDEVAFINSKNGEKLLRDIASEAVSASGTPVYFEHGLPSGTTDSFALLSIQRTVLTGLAFQNTRTSFDYLLVRMTDPALIPDLRRHIAHALTAAYGEAVRDRLLTRLPPEDKLEAYRFPNDTDNFSALFAQFVAASK